MSLLRAHYDIPEDVEEGSIKWSRITTVDVIGPLWEVGKTKPLLADELKAQRAQQRQENASRRLRSDDPLNAEPSRGRALGGKRQKRGRGAGDHEGHRGHKRARVGPAGGQVGDGADGGGGDDLPPLPNRGDGGDWSFEADLADIMQGEMGEMDMADADELASLASSDAAELQVSFEDAAHCPGHEGDPSPASPLAPTMEAAPAAVEEIIREFASSDAVEEALASDTGADQEQAPPPALDPPAEEQPWQRLGDPSQMGYCYLDGRSVLRIQRGKPKNSCTVTCYRHSGCHLLLTMARCPSTDTLKQWAFEVPALAADASPAERKAQARKHMDMAMGRWGARARKPA